MSIFYCEARDYIFPSPSWRQDEQPSSNAEEEGEIEHASDKVQHNPGPPSSLTHQQFISSIGSCHSLDFLKEQLIQRCRRICELDVTQRRKCSKRLQIQLELSKLATTFEEQPPQLTFSLPPPPPPPLPPSVDSTPRAQSTQQALHHSHQLPPS